MTDHTFPALDAALNDLARVRDQLTTVEAAYSEMETAFKIEAAPRPPAPRRAPAG